MNSKFEQSLQSDLRHSEQILNAEQLQHLACFRQQALVTQAPRRLWRVLWPTAGMILASILLLVLAMPLSPLGPPAVNDSVNDNLDLYVDLEFYYWLADSEQDLRG
jgi:hypothetical protein